MLQFIELYINDIKVEQTGWLKKLYFYNWYILLIYTTRMGYTRGIVVQYQCQGADIGIVLVVVQNHLYPIPEQYQSFMGNTAIRNKEITHTNLLPITYD